MREHPVVVVGAGPAGLATAIALAQTGIEVRLLERRASGSRLPRATVLSLRSMELLRSWGLEELIRAGADDVEMTMLAMSSAVHAARGTVIDVGYPTREQSAVLSPSQALCVAQDHLESVLLEHLAGFPTATVQRGVEVLGVTSAGSSVRVTARDSTGQVHTFDAGYVVGADGARSAVRAAAGIELRGPQVVYQGVRVQFHAPLWDALGKHRHLLYAITEPEASGVLLPAGQGDRWVFGVAYGTQSTDLAQRPSNDAVLQRLLRATGLSPAALSAARFDQFSAGAQLAEHFSRDRLFLVGDAAHRVTPRGGTGLNIALADGNNLGWKLGWVLRNWAPTSLLASYEAERRPVAQHNVQRSADPAGSPRPAADETYVDLGGRIPHRWASPGLSTIDLVGDGFTLLSADAAAASASVMGTGIAAPISAVPLNTVIAQSLGIGAHGAVLIRPDALPVAAWSTPPRSGLVANAAINFLAGPYETGLNTDSAA